MKPKFSIQEIISGCHNGQSDCQRALVNQYGDRLYATCIRYLKDKEKAKDALQETLIKVFKYFHSYDASKATLPTWMTTIAVRQCLSILSRKDLQLVSLEDAGHDEVYIDTTALDELQNQDLVNLVQQLPAGCRIVFNLSVIDGFSHKEIGDMLEIKITASRSRLKRAKEILRKKITALEILSNA